VTALDAHSAVGSDHTDCHASFRDSLFESGLLLATGIDGIYGRSATYQRVADGLCHLASLVGDDQSYEAVHFPPVLARAVFDQTDYLRSFPDLMGSVHVFHGDDRKHVELLRRIDRNEDWPALLDAADVVLCSATCHPIYPLCTGRLPAGGRRFEIHGYCFRHEPSMDPARMQAFHMHELVYVGEPERALEHRDRGLQRGLEMLSQLGLSMNSVPANDPFFGRLGVMLATSQIDDALKLEGVTPICSTEQPTAVMSANYHQDHFGKPFAIETAGGEVAHSSCVAFGVDRITLALLHRHGLEPDRWPSRVRHHLWG
jgi:seryl-tRNA synthetase